MEIEQTLRKELTTEQYNAVIDESREILTLACAGSGKSTTLAYRISRLVAQGEDPKGIVAFTFTEKAAESIKLQVSKALKSFNLEPTILGAMYIGTIHSYCQYLLGIIDGKYRQFEVLDENRLKLYLISRFNKLSLRQIQDHTNAKYFDVIKQISEAWKLMNDEMIEIARVIEHDQLLGQIFLNMSERLDEDQFIDFSLMIRLVVEYLISDEQDSKLLVSNLKHLLVDEYQDVNPAQEALIEQLHKRGGTLFVVGDDDQAIYSWRGADVSNILTFGDRYTNYSQHTLSRNFRSTSPIVESSNAFIEAELGATRISKRPFAVNPNGPRDFRKLWFRNRDEEAEWVATRISELLGTKYLEKGGKSRGLTPGDFAIIMRSTRQNDQNGSPRHAPFTNALLRRNILFSLEAGGGVFERQQVRVLRGAFELLRNDSPSRELAQEFFNNQVIPSYPNASFNAFTKVLASWGRQIHTPSGGVRRRVYPQNLVHELLDAFGISLSNFDEAIMRDLGVFSKIIQDVESVYLSIDSKIRFQELLNFLSNIGETGYDTSTEGILRKPDWVTVSTVHKMKGLESPVVFLVDLEAQRFPRRKRDYRGWFPRELIQNALDRGAYQSTNDEEVRLFYTALTRAERYLYLSGSENLPGGSKRSSPSSFVNRLSHQELFNDPTGLPEGLSLAPQNPRIDETIMPTSYSDIRYYLACPRDYQFRKSFGFSPTIKEMLGFGMTVHTAIEKLHQIYSSQVPTIDEAKDIAVDIFHLKHVSPSNDPDNRPGPYEKAKLRAGQIVSDYVEQYATDFSQRRQVEARFEIPVDNAVITGSIDLLLREDQKGNILDAKVVDFKAMQGDLEDEGETLHWTELSLQVQLYAKAARDVLGENAKTGSVHLLKNNLRIDIPVTDEAIEAAVENVEWAVNRILAGDFPMRPSEQKCDNCDFKLLCSKSPQKFTTNKTPPPIHVPTEKKREMAKAFSEFNG